MSRHEGRVLAFQALFAWELQGRPRPWIPDFSWAKEGSELDFPRYLVCACLDVIDELDAAIKCHLQNWDFERLGKTELAVLRLGAYGVLHPGETDPVVSINEAVKIAQEFAAGESYRFVNGVLDAILKQGRKA